MDLKTHTEIFAYVQELGIPLSAWAQDNGFSPSSVSEWSNDQHKPTFQNLIKLNQAVKKLQLAHGLPPSISADGTNSTVLQEVNS